MRTTLALAGLVAGAASFLAPLTPASAVCQQPLIVLDDGGGSGHQQCAPCTEEQLYNALRDGSPIREKLPENPFVCMH